jgi:diguanylate cyclase (GGDEF)-like protein
LDLDNFKFVNDSLGHAAGDELIVRVADLLSRRLRHSDVVARLGGDEFAVLLPEASAADALRVAEALLASLRSEAGAGLPRRVTASIGIALVEPHTETTAQDVLMAADIAMYDAKEEGRDQVAVYDHRRTRHTSMEDRLDWAERIRRALDEDRFVLHAQPVLSLNGDDGRSHFELCACRRPAARWWPRGASCRSPSASGWCSTSTAGSCAVPSPCWPHSSARAPTPAWPSTCRPGRSSTRV